MGLKIGEVFRDYCCLTVTATGARATLLADVTCQVKDETGTDFGAAIVATECPGGNGWYYADITPDAAGVWTTDWSKTANPENYTFHYPYKEFHVGAGQEGDLQTDSTAILADTNMLQTDWVNGGRLDLLIDAILADTGELQTDWVNGGRLDLLIDAIKAKTDNLPADPADDSDLDAALATIDGFHDVPAEDGANDAQIRDVVGKKTDTVAGTSLVSLVKIADGVADNIYTRTQHHLITRTFFSSSQISVTITNGAGDKSLPTVTLPNISGTIVHVYAGFKFRMIENTNAGANKLSGAQDIQVRVDTPGAWADGINFVDDQFGVAASTREGGDCIIGTIDLVGTVTAFNDGYEFQWDEAVADQSNLVFNDVQTFLIVSYY